MATDLRTRLRRARDLGARRWRCRRGRFNVVLRGLSMIGDDEHTLAVTKPIFNGRYEFYRRATLLGRKPA